MNDDPIVRANRVRNRRIRWRLAKALCFMVGHRWERQGPHKAWKMCARCVVSEWIPEELAKFAPWPAPNPDDILAILKDCEETAQPLNLSATDAMPNREGEQ